MVMDLDSDDVLLQQVALDNFREVVENGYDDILGVNEAVEAVRLRLNKFDSSSRIEAVGIFYSAYVSKKCTAAVDAIMDRLQHDTYPKVRL
eukprot:CAMPEP_0113707780 /NCGR_PEP_ID=MMETSP0038_2-20120614/28598_1 /TAXON_ID=2898 /ORGANISM="Cryptomonas paramecium" /LENGTH=90 /DNA_ID=CAMNT_0000633377 /DNA_START=82 /DNA_END=351 /DNA_ORIENTATION=- /assembly_acc=CAM_ASM_000170